MNSDVKCRATLNETGGSAKKWGLMSHGLCRPQRSGRVIFSARIMGDKKTGLFKVLEGVKINATAYCKFTRDVQYDWLGGLSFS